MQLETPILSIDYGIKSTGFAISLDGVNPLFLDIKSTGNISDIIEVINFYNPKTLLIGLPINSENKKQHDKVKALAGNLRQRLQIPTLFQDERFTSKIADQMLKDDHATNNKSNGRRSNHATRFDRHQIKDQAAAFVILEIFLAKQMNLGSKTF